MAMAMAMASTSKHFFFFLLLLVLSSAQTEARVSKFFSKFIHTQNNEVPQLTPTSDLPLPPSPAPEISPIFPPIEAPAPFFDESQNAYGLYGRDAGDGERSRTITDVEEEILADNGDGEENTRSGYPDTKLQSDDFGSPRRYEQNQNNYKNNNGYRNSEFENNEHRNSEYESNFENNDERNYQYQSNFENNGERNYQYQSNFENNGDGYRQRRYEPSERQGMSDTRFVENGRYFHDVNSRNGENDQGESFGKYKKNQYEFDSMEEYEKSEGFLP